MEGSQLCVYEYLSIYNDEFTHGFYSFHNAQSNIRIFQRQAKINGIFILLT